LKRPAMQTFAIFIDTFIFTLKLALFTKKYPKMPDPKMANFRDFYPFFGSILDGGRWIRLKKNKKNLPCPL
jgi:hypothetical protein